jgi:large subunit ribosomal protein L32
MRNQLHTGPARSPSMPVFILPLPFSTAMAVPKQKQSHARTSKRRAQHKISAPSVNLCPQCHQPRRPHRVCPHCGSYGGREVVDVTGTHDHDHEH